MKEPHVDEIVKQEEELAKALVANDAAAIGRFLSDDWVIVGTEGGVFPRAKFLDAVESGALTHELMDLGDWRVRVYGDCAVATCRATARGHYLGELFRTYERSTSVYVNGPQGWQCVLTQLTAIGEVARGT